MGRIMPRIPEDDLSEIFDLDDEFSDSAIINGTTITGFLSNQYIDALDVSGTVPVFLCAQSAIDAISPAVERKTGASVNGVLYTIENFKPDGSGVTQLILNKV